MPTSIEMDVALSERVQTLAERRQRSAQTVIVEAIEQYVDREERQERFRQETLSAFEEVETSGLHATIENVDDWLSSWGSADERPAPTCHR